MADIEACLFDLDGVIVDTAKYHFLAWRRLCNEMGFDLSHDDNEMLKGISRRGSLDILLAKGGVQATEQEIQEMMVRKNDWYLEYVDAMHPEEILPGVVEFLDKVKASGRKMALGSASKNSMRILEKINVLSYFEAVIDGHKVSKGKPDPETFVLGAEALGVVPAKCVVFEDAVAGVEAAIAGGMYAIGVGEPAVLHRAHKVIAGFEGLELTVFDQI